MEGRVRFCEKIEEINDKPCVIELQAFRGNKDEYIIKELVILDLLTCVVYSFLFKPPFPFKKLNAKAKKTNKWLVKNFHNIEWCEGFTSYKNLENIMYHFCNEFTTIYTKGIEKRDWIQMYTTCRVINVQMSKDDHFNTFENICISVKSKNHRKSQCALKNVYRLAAFLEQTIETSGGGNGVYKYQEEPQTQHEYYSSLQDENTYITNEDGFSTVPTISS